MERMLNHFGVLLKSFLEQPDRSIWDLDMLTTAENELLIGEWNNTHHVIPLPKLVHELIEEQVLLTPNKIATVYKNTSYTYQELNAKANQLAHMLRDRGVVANSIVPIMCERSLEMSVVILGILKAGGAYCPIDPHLPAERVLCILEDINSNIVLTQSHLLDKLSYVSAAICIEIINVDHDDYYSHYSISNPICNTCADNLSYVIYTSGSTGKPKGVLSLHGGMVNRLVWMQDYCKLTEEDRFLQKTPYGFDVSVWEQLLAYMVGATLVFAKPEGHKDPNYLRELIQKERITLLHFVPSMLDAFLTAAKDKESIAKACSTLKKVMASGEALPWALRQRFFGVLPNVELHNLYGPTEASIDVTYYDCSCMDHPTIIPIGKPVWNTSLYILNTSLRPVPIGVAGELFLGGIQLAKGYVNRMELTAERFVPNPFYDPANTSNDTISRYMYRTGDLCRYLEDGNVEYLGRMDEQVKIRGLRVELHEIEICLLKYPLVQEAVVIVRNNAMSGEQQLVAYVVCSKIISNLNKELTFHLKGLLPEYMIPNAFVPMDKIPLSGNGKINRKELPPPPSATSIGNLEVEMIAPNTETEELLSSLLCTLLQVECISTNDNFFAMGMSSISVIMLISKAAYVGLICNIKDVYENPTIIELAHCIDAKANIQNDVDGNVQNEISAEAKDDIQRYSANNSTAMCDHCKPYSAEIRCVLLTGVTGFLGVNLLIELLNTTKATITCLVRSGCTVDLIVAKMLEVGYIATAEQANRIICVLGDLSKRNLGVTSTEWSHLSECIDVIYHCGASVHHLHSYDTLWNVNIGSTIELLKLAVDNKKYIKSYHFISTISATPTSSKEYWKPSELPGNNTGYSLTKLVCEHILYSYALKGYPIRIYRPGNITNHSITGYCNPDFNRHLLLLKGFLQLGIAPIWNKPWDMCPVNIVAQSITQLSLYLQTNLCNLQYYSDDSNAHVIVCNLNHPNPISWYCYLKIVNAALIKHDHGVEGLLPSLQFMDSEEFRTTILPNIDITNAIYPFKDIYESVSMDNHSPVFIHDKETQSLMCQLNVEFPTVIEMERLITAQFVYLNKTGFLTSNLNSIFHLLLFDEN